MNMPFEDFYRGKTVLITGHTGFKGSWLAIWLTHLGADVVGYALDPPSDPNHFTASRLRDRIRHIHGDVCDQERLQKTFAEVRPSLVFHLAAQSLVRLSYREPRRTFEVNVMGTVNVLESALRSDSVQAVVAVTSDKCYRNVGWPWGYRETDELGGYDAYSASKAGAEMAIGSYQDGRFQRSAIPGKELPIASARAGNVIGGGDWAQDRIVPDSIRAITTNSDIVVRSPNATRPWQHVLEPLGGYLWLGYLLSGGGPYRTSWNFGPTDGTVSTVAHVVTGILERWAGASTKLIVEADQSVAESPLLRLDCSKANHHLSWQATWDTPRTLDAVVAWYREFYRQVSADMYSFSVQQIEEYTECARNRKLRWAE